MTNGKNPQVDAGFHEKNFLKLKEGKLWEYISSRGITFWTGLILGLLYIRDAGYVHSQDGVPRSVIFFVAIIFFMNGMRKMMWGFIKMNDAAWDESVAEKPHHRDETKLQRFFMRLPGGQRRHLINRQALVAEGLGAVLLTLYFISLGINDNLFMLSGSIPFVLNPNLFSWNGWEFPQNLWEGVVISSVAVLMSYVNNSLFLTKIPQVRGALLGILKEIPNVEHLALYFPVEIFKALRRNSGDMTCDINEATTVATRILDEYPEGVISDAHKGILAPELARVICTETDPRTLLRFLRKRIAELKKTEKI